MIWHVVVPRRVSLRRCSKAELLPALDLNLIQGRYLGGATAFRDPLYTESGTQVDGCPLGTSGDGQ